jgi:signal transduction histidine kinase
MAIVDESGNVVADVPVGGRHEAPRAGADVVASAPLTVAPWRVLVRQTEALPGPALFTRRLLVLGPTVLGVALLFAWGAARSLTRPLSALVAAAGRIAGGDIDHPVPELGDDEVGGLARSFEAMRTALARSIDALNRDRVDLERRVAERTQELAGLYDDLRHHDERRGQLIRKTISAQEDERMRIARELHDETCQSLAALLMRFDAALAVKDPEELRARISEARSLVDRALGEVHRMIFDLRPSVLDDLGLVPAIQWFAARHLEPRGIAVRCELEGMASRLPPEIETALFRVAQEALTNVARHAGAEAVLIQIARRGDIVELEIEDDGNGFDPGLVAGPSPSGRGLGLMGMRERIELLGGSAQIESSPGHGTRLAFRVALPEAVLSNGGGVG